MQKNKPPFLHLWPIRIILIIWGFFITLDYLFHHPYYEKALLEFRYWGLLVLIGLILGGSWFFLFRLKGDKKYKEGLRINGLGLYLLLLGLMVVIYGYYCSVNDLFSGQPLGHLVYFAGHTAMLHAFVFLLLLAAYSIGVLVLNPLKDYFNGVSYKMISLAIGLSLLGIIAVILGLLQLLYASIFWALMVVIFTLRYRSILPFLTTLFLKPVNSRLGWQGLLTAMVLCVFLAINAIGAIKSFPVGFDGANLYMNISKLIVEYHSLPEGGQAFNWSVIMSLGELIFGSTAVAILLAHLSGILCLIVAFRIARIFMQFDKALIASTIFYIAPYISFHNFRDEKVDLGFLFISLSALLLLLEFHFRKGKKEKPNPGLSIINWGKLKVPASLFIWILAGWLTGFAFGIKYIALLNFIAIIAYLGYINAGKFAFSGISMLALGGVFLFRVDRFAAIDLGGISPLIISGIFLLPGVITLIFYFRKAPENFKKIFYPGLLFTFFFVLAYAPWAVKHLSENQSFSVSSIIEGKSPRPVISINPDYLSSMNHRRSPGQEEGNKPDAIKDKALFTSYSEQNFNDKEARAYFVKQESEKPLSANEQVRREELYRYLGFEKGLPLYLSLPYDLTMNTNFPGHIYLDIGFLFLLLLPLLLLSFGKGSKWRNGSLVLLLGFLIVVALQAVYGGNEGFNSSDAMKRIEELLATSSPGMADSLGVIYSAIMSLFFAIAVLFSPIYTVLSGMNFLMIFFALILLLNIVLWISNDKLKSMPTGLKALCSFLFSFLSFWLFLGSGIPWYAFPALSLLPIPIVYYYANPEQLLGGKQKVFITYFFSIGIGLYFAMNLLSHFHDHNNGANAHIFLKTPFVQYAGARMDKSDVLSKFNPFYPSAVDIVNGNPTTKVYKVGTYLNYHILNNDQRVYEDNQLGLFDEITSNTTRPEHFFQILKENGFRYIIYDLRTATIDKTPEKSLTKKNKAFVNQLLNSGKAQLLVTDRIVKDPTGNSLKIGGFTFPGKAGLLGKAIYQGTFALFEIK